MDSSQLFSLILYYYLQLGCSKFLLGNEKKYIIQCENMADDYCRLWYILVIGCVGKTTIRKLACNLFPECTRIFSRPALIITSVYYKSLVSLCNEV